VLVVGGGLTRLALSDEDRRGRDLMVRWMREAGLRVTVDRMGNIFGERAGAAALPPVWMGSHVDSVPTGGKYNPDVAVGPTPEFLASAPYYATLPILSFVVSAVGGIALAMRGNAISVLGEDYLRVADLRGLPERRIALRYVARNAVLPLYTQLMISMGYIFGGSVVLETIFRYPAAGYYMLQAIEARDSPLMMGVFIAITIAVVIGVFVADLTYGFLDPRASAGGESGEVY
jgi:peptide/nickel transport system permease protein